MPVSVLSQASALNPGAELWALPDVKTSRWTVKVDWYLNFQICKAQRHATKEIPFYVQRVLDETALEPFHLREPADAPLLIPSENLLPNKWVVIIPSAENQSQWVAHIARIWESLQKPSLRIFLPTGQSAGKFNELWHAHHDFTDYTLVLD